VSEIIPSSRTASATQSVLKLAIFKKPESTFGIPAGRHATRQIWKSTNHNSLQEADRIRRAGQWRKFSGIIAINELNNGATRYITGSACAVWRDWGDRSEICIPHLAVGSKGLRRGLGALLTSTVVAAIDRPESFVSLTLPQTAIDPGGSWQDYYPGFHVVAENPPTGEHQYDESLRFPLPAARLEAPHAGKLVARLNALPLPAHAVHLM
jgi:hypothetical protein